MDAQSLIQEIRMLTNMLKTAEERYYNAIRKLKETNQNLLDKECDLFNSGKVKGRNEQTRNAELWPHTKDLQKSVLKEEAEVDEAKVEYHYVKRKLENTQLVLQLLVKTTGVK